MRRSIFLLVILFASFIFAQSLEDFIVETRGDTLVIKPTTFDAQLTDVNALGNAILADINDVGVRDNPNRVYLLQRGQYYVHNQPFNLPEGSIIRIIGEPGPQAIQPPVILPAPDAEGNVDIFNYRFHSSVTVENIYINMAALNGEFSQYPITVYKDGVDITVRNCIFEYGKYCIRSEHEVLNLTMTDNIIINNLRPGALEITNSRVYHNNKGYTHQIHFENNTCYNVFGFIFNVRLMPNSAYVNHNSFINCQAQIFYNNQFASLAFTNNICMNVNVTPWENRILRLASFDPEVVAAGDGWSVINVDTLEQGDFDSWGIDPITPAERKYLIDKNSYWCDPMYETMFETLDDMFRAQDPPDSAMVTRQWMNTRTQGIFDADDTYPLMTEVAPIDEKPDLADYWEDVNPLYMQYKIDRFQGKDEGTNFAWDNNEATVPHWPVLMDFSYTNPNLITAGLNGMPLGDLNWFPEKKSAWDSEAEKSTIMQALETGRSLDETGVAGMAPVSPSDFILSQNYPNPFNPVTTIGCTLQKSGDVTLTVYNLMGRKVKTLVNGRMPAGVHQIQWDGTNAKNSSVVSGVYFYKLETAGQSQMKKMLLVR